MNKCLSFLILLILLPGCYQSSLTSMVNVAGPAAGATQGRAISTTISSGISYGVKQKTGKYPIEHIIKREKEKITNKVVSLGGEAKNKSLIIKDKIVKSSQMLFDKKESSKAYEKDRGKTPKLRWVLHVKEIKNTTHKETFVANKPRYSYSSKEK